MDALRASSTVKFLESMQSRIEMYMIAGDVATVRRNKLTGKPRVYEQDEINKETKEAFDRCKSGEKFKDVAESMGLTYNSLKCRFNSRGWKLKSRDERYTKREILRLYDKGVSMAKIGAKVDLNWQSVRRRLIDYGVELRPNGKGNRKQ